MDSLPVPIHNLNPFVPGAGRLPKELVGRENELEAMDRIAARTKLGLSNQGIIYSGLRGIGKTVLLLSMRKIADERHLMTVQIEASGEDSALRDYDALFHEIPLALARIKEKHLRERMMNAFSEVESASLEFMGVKAGFNLSKKPGKPDYRTDSFRLELLIERYAQELKEAHSGFVLFVDELQEMNAELLSTLISLQHKMGQQNLPFYIIGAGLPNLPGVLTKIRSYAERLFEYRQLDRLTDDEAQDGFQKAAKSIGRPFDDEALELLVELSQGYPYFVQAYGKSSWDMADSNPIKASAVIKGKPLARESLDSGLYSSRWQRASVAERAYLQTMAELGEPCNTGEVAEKMGKNLSSVSMTRDTLIKHDLAYSPKFGQIAFTVPGMGDFIKRMSASS